MHKLNTVFKVFQYSKKSNVVIVCTNTSICCTSFRGISSTNVRQSASTSAPANNEAASIVLDTKNHSLIS